MKNSREELLRKVLAFLFFSSMVLMFAGVVIMIQTSHDQLYQLGGKVFAWGITTFVFVVAITSSLNVADNKRKRRMKKERLARLAKSFQPEQEEDFREKRDKLNRAGWEEDGRVVILKR